jgi:hypothetical protein
MNAVFFAAFAVQDLIAGQKLTAQRSQTERRKERKDF